MIILLALAVNRIEPAAPSAFYTPPDPLTAGDAGTVVRSEPLQGLPAGTPYDGGPEILFQQHLKLRDLPAALPAANTWTIASCTSG